MNTGRKQKLPCVRVTYTNLHVARGFFKTGYFKRSIFAERSGRYVENNLPLKFFGGLIVMTAELEAAGKSLFVNEVPEMTLGY